jgi:hypothetical protein
MKRDLEKLYVDLQQVPDATSLSKVMAQVFNEQITEQRRLIYNLLENGESFTMPTAGTSGHTVATQISSGSPVALDVSQVDSILAQVTKNHKKVVRTLLGALLLVAMLGSFVVYVLATHFGPQAGAARAKRVDQNATQVAATTPVNPRPAETAAGTSVVPAAEIRFPTATVTAAVPPSVQASAPSRNTASANKAKSLGRKEVAEPQTSVVEYGYISLDTTPWSLVSTGGKSLGQTPILGVKIPTGTHVLTLRNPDLGIETQYSVTIEAGKTLARRIGLQ